MRTANLFIAALFGVVVCGAATESVRAQQPSARDGIYTQAQATRGQKIYEDKCADCHGPKLLGEAAPSLAGKEFIDAWKNMSVGGLLDVIGSTMPADMPGTLKVAERADVLAYVLSVNKFPAGQSELGSEVAPLKLVALSEPPQ